MIDTHAHLTSDAFLESVHAVLERAQENNIEKIVNICTDEQSLKRGIELHLRYPWVFNTAATTPHDVEKEGESFFPLVQAAAQKGGLIAIGETGLDYFYEHSPKELQQKFLLRYLQLAKACQLPIIFHCRDAFLDLFSLVDEIYTGFPALLHCFTGTKEEARQCLERGWLISFSGIITFKTSVSLREVVEYVPLDRLVVETDAPYLAPQSQRGKTNEPSYIVETIHMVAHLKGLTDQDIIQATTATADKFFSFSKRV